MVSIRRWLPLIKIGTINSHTFYGIDFEAFSAPKESNEAYPCEIGIPIISIIPIIGTFQQREKLKNNKHFIN
jgi:hypothetical protein